jgi:hypothetical protein
MRLNYSEQNNGSLAIVDNWTSYKYGLSTRENILPYEINIMTHLKFIYHSAGSGYCSWDELMYPEPLDNPLLSLRFSVTRGWFHYKGRAFAVPNKSFDKFLKKMKQRYQRKIELNQRKIALKKNPINLRYREIIGKFKF